ncbi:MAG: flagellar protein FlaG [Paracoccaceae bacterium]|jgi:flagellar protein FlaG
MDTSLRTAQTAINSVPLPQGPAVGNKTAQGGSGLPPLKPEQPALPVKEVPKQPPPVAEKVADVMTETREAVRKINDVLRERNRDIEFSVDEGSGKTVVKVIHRESGEVIRQFPPEVVLNFAHAFTEGSASLLEEFA